MKRIILKSMLKSHQDKMERLLEIMLKRIQQLGSEDYPEPLEYAIFFKDMEEDCTKALKLLRKKQVRPKKAKKLT